MSNSQRMLLNVLKHMRNKENAITTPYVYSTYMGGDKSIAFKSRLDLIDHEILLKLYKILNGDDNYDIEENVWQWAHAYLAEMDPLEDPDDVEAAMHNNAALWALVDTKTAELNTYDPKIWYNFLREDMPQYDLNYKRSSHSVSMPSTDEYKEKIYTIADLISLALSNVKS